jgi:hypothetical protein
VRACDHATLPVGLVDSWLPLTRRAAAGRSSQAASGKEASLARRAAEQTQANAAETLEWTRTLEATLRSSLDAVRSGTEALTRVSNALTPRSTDKRTHARSTDTSSPRPVVFRCTGGSLGSCGRGWTRPARCRQSRPRARRRSRSVRGAQQLTPRLADPPCPADPPRLADPPRPADTPHPTDTCTRPVPLATLNAGAAGEAARGAGGRAGGARCLCGAGNEREAGGARGGAAGEPAAAGTGLGRIAARGGGGSTHAGGGGGGRAVGSGAASVAFFLAAVLTEIYLCNVCSCHEILRRDGRG